MTFFLTQVFMVLVFWRPQDWLFPELSGIPMLNIITFMALLSLAIESREGKISVSLSNHQIMLFAGLWFATLASHITGFYYQGTMDTLAETYKYSVFGILLILVLDRPSRLRWTVRVFVAMACVMSVNSLMQERLGYGFAGSQPIFIPASERGPMHVRTQFFGIFNDPNDLAQVLVTSIPFAFLIFQKRSFLSMLVVFGIVWLLAAAILSTHSRGGLVALAAASVLMSFLLLPSRWLPYLLLPGVAGALLLCPFSGAALDKSAYDRVVFWGMANWNFKLHPVFGIGYGMFWQVAGDTVAHNAFVECYTTLGFFGYWFWFGLLLLGVVGAWRSRVALASASTADELWLRRFAGLAIAAAAGYVTAAYFLSRAFIFPTFFLVSMLASVPVITQKFMKRGAPPLLGSLSQAAAMCTVGALVSIVYIYFSIVLLNKAMGG